MKSTLYLLAGLLVAVVISWSLGMANEEKGHICFRVIDSDKNGKVTFQEFKKYFGDDIKKFNAIDLDKDGTLSHDEYHKSLGHGS